MYSGEEDGHTQIIYYFAEVAELRDRQKALEIQAAIDSLEPGFDHCDATGVCFTTAGYAEKQPPLSKKQYEDHVAEQKAYLHGRLTGARRTSGTAEIIPLFA